VALIVLDAGVVIGFLDRSDAHHGAAVTELSARRGDQLVLPTSAFAETLVRPYQAGPAAVAAVDAFVRDLAVELHALTPPIAHRAASLRARYSALALPDAIVLATGDVLDASVVVTTDRAWRRVSRRVRAI
jgi:predicted nucleic acid-binding protein